MTWEYRIDTMEAPIVGFINALGQEGWEVFQITMFGGTTFTIFSKKRK